MNQAGQQRVLLLSATTTTEKQSSHHIANQQQPPPPPPPGRTRPPSLQLSCITGFTGAYRQTLLCHPHLSDIYIVAIGPVIVISNLSDPNQQRFLHGHHQNVVAITISRSGRYIVSGEISSPSSHANTCICLWDFHSGAILNRFGCTRGQVKLVEFTTDDRWIAACSDDNVLNIWEIQSGDLVLAAPRQQYSAMKFGPAIPSSRSRRNPSYLLFACIQNSVLILIFHYDIKTMQYEMTSRRCDVSGRCALIRTFTCCTLDEDNTHLLCGTTAGDICIFQLDRGQYTARFQVGSGGVQSVVVRGDIVVVGGGDGTLYKYGRTGPGAWQLQTQMKLCGSLTSLSISSDGTEILSGSNQSCIYRSRLSDLQSLLVQRSSPGPITQVAFPSDPERSLAATISSCGAVMVWDLADYSIISNYQGTCPGTSIIFVSDDKGTDAEVLTGWDDASIRLYSIADERIIWQIYDAARGAITALQQHQHVIVVAGSKSGAIRIWNRSSRTMISEYVAHSCSPIIDVILDQTRPHLIHSLGPDRRLVSYDYHKKLYISRHQLDDSVFQAISQRRQGEFEIAAGLADGRILIYDLDLSDPVYIHESTRKKSITDLSFSFDGRYLVTAEAPDQIVLYEFTHQQQLLYRASLSLHSSKITSVCFSPDTRHIICTCQDSSMSIVGFELNPI